ncbi:MAG: hypothetical protein Q4C47_06545, partial [Planctomycetia bacterium]|nr:hypothetical protein [Planctomycetia bacterium]
MDEERHRRGTGVSCGPILENFRRLVAYAAEHDGPEIRVRIPVIPSFNADVASQRAIAEFLDATLRDLPESSPERRNQVVRRVSLLPYHRLGSDKRTKFVSGANRGNGIRGVRRTDEAIGMSGAGGIRGAGGSGDGTSRSPASTLTTDRMVAQPDGVETILTPPDASLMAVLAKLHRSYGRIVDGDEDRNGNEDGK